MVFGLDEMFSKKSHAERFAEAFKKQDDLKLKEIFKNWEKNGNHDANFCLARIIMGLKEGSIKSTDAFEAYLDSIKRDVDDSSLFDWFNILTIELMEKQVDEEIGFSEMFNNKYKSNSPSNSYAEEFLNCLDNVLDNQGNLDELNEILSKWEENYPEDANMHCAYVIVNIVNMSSDELENRKTKANECIPVDKNNYPKFLALMNGVCRLA